MGAGLKVGVALALLAALAATAADAAVAVWFEVDLRAEIAAQRFDPARDAVGLRGAVAPLSWQASLPLAPLGDGRYAVTVTFDAPAPGAQPVPHKFRIERPGLGADEGWEPGRNHAAVIDGPAPRIARAFGAAEAPPPAHIAGTVLRLGPVVSRHVAPRPVSVWLPPGYAQSPRRRYPVLYLQDGQNLFDASASGAEWQVDETAQRLVLARAVAPMIIVAVPSGRDRIAELTPTAATLDEARSGRAGPAQRVGGAAPAYARFLLDELKPLIDRRLRTRPDAASTAVGGSSLGGLFALWLVLHHGDRVGAALVVSPSVWWDDAYALRDVRGAVLGGTARPRLWLDIGGQEGEGALAAVRALRDALRARGWTATTLAYTEAPEGRHDELSWAARVEGMLRFLYGAAPR